MTADGGFLIVDVRNHVVRKVSADGVINRVAGTWGPTGSEEDDGPAGEARLDLPSALAMTDDGGFLIADYGKQIVCKVSAEVLLTWARAPREATGTAARRPMPSWTSPWDWQRLSMADS